jgi:hypothetical protein
VTTTKRVLVVSDVHAGSAAAIWPEGYAVNGNEIKPNKLQAWMMQCWRYMLADAENLRPDVVVLDGDLIQGTNPRDGQLTCSRLDGQLGAAAELLKPLTAPVVKRGGKVYQIIGTEFHDGKGGENVELLGERLGVTKDEAAGAYGRWELFLDIGTVIHFTHHTGTTGDPKSEATAPLRDAYTLAQELTLNYRDHNPGPRCFVRSHRHRFIHVHAAPDLHVVVSPSWQFRNAFTYRKAASTLPHIGYVWLEWDGQDLTVRPRLFNLPAFTVQVEKA